MPRSGLWRLPPPVGHRAWGDRRRTWTALATSNKPDGSRAKGSADGQAHVERHPPGAEGRDHPEEPVPRGEDDDLAEVAAADPELPQEQGWPPTRPAVTRGSVEATARTGPEKMRWNWLTPGPPGSR